MNKLLVVLALLLGIQVSAHASPICPKNDRNCAIQMTPVTVVYPCREWTVPECWPPRCLDGHICGPRDPGNWPPARPRWCNPCTITF